MRKLYGFIGALALLVGLFGIVHSSNTCTPTDIMCFVSGPSQNTTTNFRVDASGNVTANNVTAQGTLNVTGVSTFTGNQVELGNEILGATGVSVSSVTTASNTALAFFVYLSTQTNAVAAPAGGVVLSTTSTGSNIVGVVLSSQTSAGSAKTFLGIADSAASTGTVVQVDYSGIAVALTTGTVAPGDLLVTTNTVTGALATNNSAAAGSIVGVALEANVNSLTRILLRH